MLKHVSLFFDRDGRTVKSRYAVAVDGDRIVVRPLAGPALPAEYIWPVLQAALPEEVLKQAEELHRSRKNPWRVDCRVGMSGCSDYCLYILRDGWLLDQPCVARIHVSMHDKLNHGFCLWLGDLPPLLAAVLQDYPPPAPHAEWSVRVDDPELRGEYNDPGENSGLQEVLDSLKAMEVMAE